MPPVPPPSANLLAFLSYLLILLPVIAGLDVFKGSLVQLAALVLIAGIGAFLRFFGVPALQKFLASVAARK